MKTLRVGFSTGRHEFNKDIMRVLQPSLTGFAIELVEPGRDIPVDFVVCTVEMIKMFENTPLLVLSDSSDCLVDNESVVDYTPFPITEDDYARLEWRLISAISNLRDGS